MLITHIDLLTILIAAFQSDDGSTGRRQHALDVEGEVSVAPGTRRKRVIYVTCSHTLYSI